MHQSMWKSFGDASEKCRVQYTGLYSDRRSAEDALTCAIHDIEITYQGISGTGSICNVWVLTELQWIYWKGTQGEGSLLNACVENEKKTIFSFYPGLSIYNRWVMQGKELNKKKTIVMVWPLLLPFLSLFLFPPLPPPSIHLQPCPLVLCLLPCQLWGILTQPHHVHCQTSLRLVSNLLGSSSHAKGYHLYTFHTFV